MAEVEGATRDVLKQSSLYIVINGLEQADTTHSEHSKTK